MFIICLDEFAVQTCYLGRYGEETGSDQFGATLMISQDNNVTNGNQRVAVRLSNVEVNDLFVFVVYWWNN